MPRYVDHADRRGRIAAAAAELVGASGLDALTFRNVADSAGYSTTVLTHYFADKRDLLLSTYRSVAHKWGTRFDAAQAHGGLRECLEALLPLDAQRLSEWRLLTSYRSAAVGDAELAMEFASHVASGQRRVALLLNSAYPGFDGLELEMLARRLVALVEGLSTYAAIDPGDWPPERLRQVMAHELEYINAYAQARVTADEPPRGPAKPATEATRRRGTSPARRARALRQAAGSSLRRDILSAVKQQTTTQQRRTEMRASE